jgi:ABC-type transport system involved in multi-copper enzyme maturation permease subunit
MLPGPVFAVEMITTARRRRYYAIRLLYGIILLLIIWQSYLSNFGWSEPSPWREYSVHQMSAFARSTYIAFVMTQGITIAVLTPALVAGVIADEKQRKTLHYLLASALSGGEIVLGKLLARLLHLGVFLAIGLPVLSLLTLFGGIDPREIVLVYVGTGAAMFFLAALSILVSTYARRVRDAILVAFLLELAWLVIPPLITLGLSSWRPALYGWIRPVSEWVFAVHPFALIDVPWLRGTNTWMERFWWMVGLQIAYGSVFVAWAVWRLRPVFRNQEVRWRWTMRLGRWRGRLLPRPSCGDDPMLWKERYVSRLRGVTRLIATLVTLALFSFGVYGLWLLGWEAFKELSVFGYGAVGWQQAGARQRFHEFLQAASGFLYVLMMLGVASIASSGVSAEREEDTWISLLATPLEGEEILRAKMFGAAWGVRWFALVLVLLWAIGLMVGSVHPFGILAVLIELAVDTWFVVALGTYFSLRARTTTRALGWTIGLLVFSNVGYLLILAMAGPEEPILLFGCTPFVIVVSLLSFDDVWALLGIYHDGGYGTPFRSPDGVGTVSACVLSVLAYGFAALVLTLGAFSTFDQVADRPRRDGPVLPPLRRDKPKADVHVQKVEDQEIT